MTHYDLAIIGSGPGGYVAGLYASGHKLKVCVIEKDLVGGTCLNRGCIPTKSLLNSASILSGLKDAPLHGIEITGHNVDFAKVLSRKDEVVLRLRTGIETLITARKIDLVRGRAEISDPNTIDVARAGKIGAKNIIVASGSRVAGLPGFKIDETDILSSDGILNVKSIPKSIVIIGGGVIGCEFANLFNAFGAKVRIVEFLDRLIATQSREASRRLEAIFRKKGIEINTSSSAEEAVNPSTGSGLTLSKAFDELEPRRRVKAKSIRVKISGGKIIFAEKVLVAVGRRPYCDGLGLEKLGIKIDAGRIVVDDFLATGVSSIYAIGDCVDGPMLAHKASYDAMVACDNILGKSRSRDYSNIPNCIWTEPEIASVGLSEEEARIKYPDSRAAKFPYLASGKAYLEGRTEGFVKIVGNAKGDILGVEILGKSACDLIGEAVLAKTLGINIRNWANVVHGHPTLSEILQEAAHVFCGTAIHSA